MLFLWPKRMLAVGISGQRLPHGPTARNAVSVIHPMDLPCCFFKRRKACWRPGGQRLPHSSTEAKSRSGKHKERRCLPEVENKGKRTSGQKQKATWRRYQAHVNMLFTLVNIIIAQVLLHPCQHTHLFLLYFYPNKRNFLNFF